MRSIKIKLYKFSELSKEAQEKVIEKNRDINVEFCEWFDFVFDDWYSKLNDFGFEECKISFSGFWSQGDGASFTGKIYDFKKFLKGPKYKKIRALIRKEKIELYGEIEVVNNHYEHEHTKRFRLHCDELKDFRVCIDQAINELESEIEGKRLEMSKLIYRDLEKNYWDLISDESVKSTIEINGYEFLEDGEQFFAD